MSQAQRAQRHQRMMAHIEQMCVLNSSTKEIDEERTTAQRERLMRQLVKGYEATELGCEAFDRLLRLAETRSSGQIRRVAEFLAVCWGDGKLDPTDLRNLDEQIGDDMVAVLNAIRHGVVAVHTMATDARARVPQVLRAWNLL